MGYADEFRRNWSALSGAALGLALGAAFNHYASNLFGPELREAFGWSMADLALAGVFTVINLLWVPLAGRLADRFGPRRAAAVGFTAVPLSYLGYSFMTGDIIQYYALTVFHQVFAVLTTTLVFSRVIVTGFDSARGMALSLMMSGPPLAAATLLPVLGEVIAAEGWRTAYRIMALTTMVAGMLAIWAIGSTRAEAVERPRLTLAAFVGFARHRAFLLLNGGFLLINIPQSLVGGQLNLMLMDNGASKQAAVWIASFYAWSVVAGRFASGLALDRLPSWLVALLALGLPAIGYCALATGFDPVWLLVGAVVLIGLAQGAEGDLGAYIASRKFDRAHFSLMYAFLIVAIGIASAISSSVMVFTLNRTNSFDQFLIVCAVATLAGTMAMVLAARANSGSPANV